MQVTGDISAYANVTSTRTLAQNAATPLAPPVPQDSNDEDTASKGPVAANSAGKPSKLNLLA